MPSLSSPASQVSSRRRGGSAATDLSNSASRSSSLQEVWNEDYYYDNSSTFDTVTSSKPAKLTERRYPRSVPFSENEEQAATRQTRTHQPSLTAIIPFSIRSPQRSPERSPRKEKTEFEFMPTLTGDKDGTINIAEKPRGGLSGWFNGTSAPVAVGIQADEQDDAMEPPISPQILRKRSPTTTSVTTITPSAPKTGPSRFNFFSKITAPTPPPVQVPTLLADELLTLSISHALFPAGLPQSTDTFSPSSFKNLHQNAEALLTRFQTAYLSRTMALTDVQAEASVHAEELEEANTRAAHLKMQLEGMAKILAQQTEDITQLQAGLQFERAEREKERAAREQSLLLVKGDHHLSVASSGSTGSSKPRRDRRSDSSFSTSDNEDGRSEVDSVFSNSRSMSPTLTDRSSVFGGRSPSLHSHEFLQSVNGSIGEIAEAKVVMLRPAAMETQTLAESIARREASRPKQVQQRSTFQKLMGTGPPVASVDPNYEDTVGELGTADVGCKNCRGGTAEVAWDTVGLLKLENRGLKERVGDLEKGVEGALDLVAGLGLRL